MNPVSPLFEKIDASIEKKANLLKTAFTLRCSSGSRLFVLTLGTAVAFAIAMKGKISRMV